MTLQDPMWNAYAVPCVCEGLPEGSCPCAKAGGAERVLRHICATDGKLTPEQRKWCLGEIAKVEGWDVKEFETAGDVDVARGVIAAWVDYCRDKGLL